jgi:hypothetical protein
VVLFGAESQAQWLPRSAGGSTTLGVGGPPLSTRLGQISLEAVLDAWRALPRRAVNATSSTVSTAQSAIATAVPATAP